jgi:putative glutamine amidotransferase
LTGGEDLQPSLYCSRLPRRLKATVKKTEPERDLFELLLIQEVFRQRKPLFAICRGHQLMNVAMGGTLLVDIGIQLRKSLNHSDIRNKCKPVHTIHVLKGSLLWSALRKETLSVNSTHHQAIDRLADIFHPTAVSPDGIIEATELAPAARQLLPWYLSVQFHPERLCFHYREFRALFTCFVKACNSASRGIA